MTMKTKAAVVLLVLALSASLVTQVVSTPSADAATTYCGSKDTSTNWGKSIFGVFITAVTHRGKTLTCREGNRIISNQSTVHTCNKGWYAIANSITKSKDVGPSGSTVSVTSYTCDFHGGLQYKGVGLGITRNYHLSHKMYLASGQNLPRVTTNTWSTCC